MVIIINNPEKKKFIPSSMCFFSHVVLTNCRGLSSVLHFPSSWCFFFCLKKVQFYLTAGKLEAEVERFLDSEAQKQNNELQTLLLCLLGLSSSCSRDNNGSRNETCIDRCGRSSSSLWDRRELCLCHIGLVATWQVQLWTMSLGLLFSYQYGNSWIRDKDSPFGLF